MFMADLNSDGSVGTRYSVLIMLVSRLYSRDIKMVLLIGIPDGVFEFWAALGIIPKSQWHMDSGLGELVRVKGHGL
jgi:hypothetical protein